MKFSEAVALLKNGAKIGRTLWGQNIYFHYDGNVVNTYQAAFSHYNPSADIMMSQGWSIIGQEGEFQFCDIVAFLQQGHKAKLNDWSDDKHIYYDSSVKELVIHFMEIAPFIPSFDLFLANDWIEIK